MAALVDAGRDLIEDQVGFVKIIQNEVASIDVAIEGLAARRQRLIRILEEKGIRVVPHSQGERA